MTPATEAPVLARPVGWFAACAADLPSWGFAAVWYASRHIDCGGLRSSLNGDYIRLYSALL